MINMEFTDFANLHFFETRGLDFWGYVPTVFGCVPKPVVKCGSLVRYVCLSRLGFVHPCALLTFIAVVTEVGSGYCGLVTLAAWLLRVQGLAVFFCSHDYWKAAEVPGDV